jgi:FkbM family methyltransferase
MELVRYPAGTRSGAQLASVLQQLDPDLLVDVGANRGDFSALCRALGYRGRIIAFDPAGGSNEWLEKRAKDDDDWIVVPIALGDASGEVELKVSEDGVLSSLLPASPVGLAEYDALRRTESARVRIARLDEVLTEVAPGAQRIFLKSDTQGFDLRVLEGAAGVLDRVVAIHIELSPQPFYDGAPDYLEVLAWLRERGFEPSDVVPGAMHAGLLAEIDCLLRRRP